MMKKIYLSPSDQTGNMYAYGGFRESEICRMIAEKMEKLFEKDKNFSCKVGSHEAGYVGRTSDSNSWGADLHIPIHTNACSAENAGKATGTVIFVYSLNGENLKVAELVAKNISEITLSHKYQIRVEKSLYEISKSNAICCYVEVDFHDNKETARWLSENTDSIAMAIYNGVREFYGLPAEKLETVKDFYYKVQAGSYTKKKLAENLRDEIFERDLPCYVAVEGGVYKVYVGSFRWKENAKKMVETLRRFGFDGIVKKVEGEL